MIMISGSAAALAACAAPTKTPTLAAVVAVSIDRLSTSPALAFRERAPQLDEMDLRPTPEKEVWRLGAKAEALPTRAMNTVAQRSIMVLSLFRLLSQYPGK